MALAETELGAKDWNEALVDVAAKYANPNFSDFATDLATSYSKGVSVIEAVERKSRQIKSANLLTAKEKAAALTSKILVPTMMFKMIPLRRCCHRSIFYILHRLARRHSKNYSDNRGILCGRYRMSRLGRS